MEDQGVDGRILLKWIFYKYGMNMWIRFKLFKIRSTCGFV
jgi:hypothetical protein